MSSETKLAVKANNTRHAYKQENITYIQEQITVNKNGVSVGRFSKNLSAKVFKAVIINMLQIIKIKMV